MWPRLASNLTDLKILVLCLYLSSAEVVSVQGYTHAQFTQCWGLNLGLPTSEYIPTEL